MTPFYGPSQPLQVDQDYFLFAPILDGIACVSLMIDCKMGIPGKVDQIEDLFAMSRIAILAAAAAVLACLTSECRADEPIARPRSFPVQPQTTYEIMPPLQGTTGMLPPTPTTRQNRYEHWQYVGVTRTGEFRPRVLYLPDGDTIWAFDGTHYPWFTTHMNWAVPFFISQ